MEEPPVFGLQMPLAIKRKLDQKPTSSIPNLMKPNSQAQLSQKQPASKQGGFNKNYIVRTRARRRWSC